MKLIFAKELQDYFPAEIEVQASTPLDALSLICNQHPLLGKIDLIPIRIKESSDVGLLNDPTVSSNTFTIVSAKSEVATMAYSGAGGGGGGERRSWLTVIVGVALIAVTGGFGAGLGISALSAGGSMAAFGSILGNIGIAIALQGLMGLLAPQPKKEDSRKGNNFSGDKVTTEVGTPIQFILGEIRAYPQLLSFNVNARNFDGIDRPKTSPYFKGKADENLPEINVNKYYGYVRAGDETKIQQTNNDIYRTGRDF